MPRAAAGEPALELFDLVSAVPIDLRLGLVDIHVHLLIHLVELVG